MSSRLEKRTYWTEVVGRYDKSGQTQSAFCKSENINVRTFGYWLSQLKKKNTYANASSKVSGTFSRVSLNQQREPAFYQAKLPNGIGCSIPTGFDSAELITLLEVLTHVTPR